MNISQYLQDRFPDADPVYIEKYLDVCKKNATDGYRERHHILPKSIFPEFKNLSRHRWNRVDLSYVDHTLAHFYIAKATNHSGMWISVICMLDYGRNDVPLTEEDVIQIARVREESKGMMYRTEESKVKQSQARIGKYAGKNHPLYGTSPSEEVRKRIADKLRGMPVSKETVEKRARTMNGWHPMRGKKFSDEFCELNRQIQRSVRRNTPVWERDLYLRLWGIWNDERYRYKGIRLKVGRFNNLCRELGVGDFGINDTKRIIIHFFNVLEGKEQMYHL